GQRHPAFAELLHQLCHLLRAVQSGHDLAYRLLRKRTIAPVELLKPVYEGHVPRSVTRRHLAEQERRGHRVLVTTEVADEIPERLLKREYAGLSERGILVYALCDKLEPGK